MHEFAEGLLESASFLRVAITRWFFSVDDAPTTFLYSLIE